MRTKDELFRAAQREIATRRQRAVMQADSARRVAFAAHPELAAADDARMRAGLGLAKAAALGGNFAAAQAALADADAALHRAYKEAGYGEDAFAPTFTCPACGDTGMQGGRTCRCVAETARRLRREEINAASPLGLCRFDSFEVTRYSDAVEPELGIPPRVYMQKLLDFCKNYAAQFSPDSKNLLFMGSSGLGKTHLALAIADAVLENGHDVLYTSSAALAAHLGREHFDYDARDEWLTACQEADLLILDDLGTEMPGQFVTAALYGLLNDRLLANKPMVISTNLNVDELTRRYSPQIASRLHGSFNRLTFVGEDIRVLKNRGL